MTGKREETCEGREGGGAQSSSGVHQCLEDEIFEPQFDLENELVDVGEEDEEIGADEDVQVEISLPNTVNK